ncbi:MAG: PAS domain-containing protein [Helicobacteraceae bacterium]|nr:PAS domain-containing protein [Candidatus Sulfurimonas ponti]
MKEKLPKRKKLLLLGSSQLTLALRKIFSHMNEDIEIKCDENAEVVLNSQNSFNLLLTTLEYKERMLHYKDLQAPILFLSDDEANELREISNEIEAKYYLSNSKTLEVLFLNISNLMNYHLENCECVSDQHLMKEYKETVDASNIVSKTDIYGVITFVNEQFCEISGYHSSELIGKPHNIIRHPEMPEEAFSDLWETILNKKIWKGKVKNLKKDGGSYYVDTTIKPIVDHRGVIIEFIGIRKDITELEELRLQLESELNITSGNLQEMIKRSNEYHKAMDESTILTRASLDGSITYVNKEFTEALGYAPDEIVGKDHRILKHPDTPKVIIKNLWDTIKSGKTWKGMIQNLNKFGETVWLDTVIVPIKNMEEQIVEYLTIRHNVSEIIHLHEEIETTQGELIYSLGSAAETRSRETGNHIKRVAHYSKLIATLVGLDNTEAEILFQASPMHDIGKLGIPDYVLKKPGKLTSEEWDIMRTHSELGYKILNASNRPILKAAATLAYEHHEKWNGSGYPRGLSGENIHIYGRITAVADVFDALGSDRVYKKAWRIDDILKLFKEERGKHFDPNLIDLFLENLDSFLLIRDKFQD